MNDNGQACVDGFLESPLIELCFDAVNPDVVTEIPMGCGVLGVRLADSIEGRNAAGALIKKMYSWRGYAGVHSVEDNPNVTTITAEQGGVSMATVSVTVDSKAGLLADEVFSDVLADFRKDGSRICEITKLAVDKVGTKSALAALFHILFIQVRAVYKCTDMFIEVNPRHRRYYERLLGFECLSEIRNNPRVDAPAYLLWLSSKKGDDLIERYAGSMNGESRSLYPYFYSKKEEMAIESRILGRVSAL